MCSPEIAEITENHEPFTDDILHTMHRMVHQVDDMHKMLQAFRPVLEAYQRGGVIGARTAAKRMSRGTG